VLNSAHRADDAAALFNYGFSATERIEFVKRGQKLATSRVSSFPRRSVPVVAKSTMAALTFKGSDDVFRMTTSVSRTAGKRVKAGEQLGKIEVTLDDAPLEKGLAVAQHSESAPNALAGVVAFIWYSLCWTGKIIAAPFRIF
jgi:D-alanyl-D-alanine carboxypeptidase